jgi:protein-disulfide isomerase
VRRQLLALIAIGLLPLPAHPQSSTDVGSYGYDRGSSTAPITVIEFGDFACSACAKFAVETFAQFNREYIATGRVRWKFIPFILGSFPNSTAATRAAECAADQDSFWSMHDRLYEKQKEWFRLTRPYDTFAKFAAELGLDIARFRKCYDDNVPAGRISRNNKLAAELLVRGTPTFFINGQRAVGALPIEQWRKIMAVVAGR